MLHHILPLLVILPPLVYGLVGLTCGQSWFRRQRQTVDFTPPVTILKPVKGMDAESFENFASFCQQEYPAWQIVFAVASAGDPAIPVIERLKREFPGVAVDLVVDERIYGPNYKVCNLINAWPKVRHDFIIVCDSDIRVGPRYLREVCAPFADRRVGLVTSLYRTSGVKGAGCAVEAMGFTVEMVPNVMVALALEGLSFALGASMAVRKAALEEIGGFPVLVDYLADDYQLGNRILKAGYQLELSGYFVESVMHRESLATVLSRQLRWARTMRVSRPGGYFASGFTQPIPFALLALITSGFTPAGGFAVLLLYLVRTVVALVYSRSFVGDKVLPRWLWLLPFRDLCAFVTWALSFAGNRVRWRGHLYRLYAGGKIEEIR